MVGIYGRTFGKIHDPVSIRRRRHEGGGGEPRDPSLPRLVAGRGAPRERPRQLLTPLRAVLVSLAVAAGATAVFGLEALGILLAVVFAIGALALLVGFVAARPWRPLEGPPIRQREGPPSE